MKHVRRSTTCLLMLTTAFLWGQGNSDEYQVWDLTPMVVVYPDEQLTLLTTAPLPASCTTTSDDGSVTVYKTFWRAIGGHIESADERMIVYHAPAQEGVYLVYWSDGVRTFGFFVKVKEDGWGDYTINEATFEGQRGVFLPLARPDSAPVSLFLINQRPQGIQGKPAKPTRVGFVDNQGNYRFDPPNKPFFPNRRPRCQNGQCQDVREYTTQSLGIQKELGKIEITYGLSLKLEAIGVDHTRGVTVNVLANITRTLHFDRIDCYRCENGQCQYIGSRIEYLVCEKVNNYLSPQWMCDALRRWQEKYPDQPSLFPDFPPCGIPIQVERGCQYTGDCVCPPRDTPSFTRGCT